MDTASEILGWYMRHERSIDVPQTVRQCDAGAWMRACALWDCDRIAALRALNDAWIGIVHAD